MNPSTTRDLSVRPSRAQTSRFRFHRPSIPSFSAALVALLFAALPARAGSMPLEWNPVTDPDVAGYKVYYGTATGSYGAPVDVGSLTTATLGNLSDCTRYYIAVKAYDTSGNQSAVFSDEVVGYATPVSASVSPATGERGRTVTVTVTGANFDTGVTASFLDPKVVVTGATLVSCSQLRLTVAIAMDATLGARTLEVTNLDGSFTARTSAFQVTDVSAPGVTSTSPAAGATNVAISVQPSVTFTEPMDGATITASSVRLLLADGTQVAQAPGSPSLDPSGTSARITPAASLQYSTTYRVLVTTAARDAQGTPMAAAFTMSPGFATAAAPATPPSVSSTTPGDGATGVPAGIQPAVVFNEAMLAATISASTVQLLAPDGSSVPQAPGSPLLDATGTVATIVPASPLTQGATYRLRILGGASGVKDLASTSMTATFTQATGFTIKSPPGQVTGLRRKDRH